MHKSTCEVDTIVIMPDSTSLSFTLCQNISDFNLFRVVLHLTVENFQNNRVVSAELDIYLF